MIRIVLWTLLLIYGVNAYAQELVPPPPDSSGSGRSEISAQRMYFGALKELLNGSDEEAKNQFTLLLSMYPDYYQAGFELARIYFRQQNFEIAASIMEKVVEQEPRNYFYYELLLNIYLSSGNTPRLLKHFKGFIDRFPEKGEWLHKYKDVLIAENKYDEALEVLKKIIEKEGEQEKFVIQGFELYLKKNKPKEATEHLYRYLGRYPCSENVSITLSNYLFSNRKPSEAISILQTVIECDPNNEIATLTLAEYYQKHGDTLKAHHFIKLAFENPAISVSNKVQYVMSFYALDDLSPSHAEKLTELAGIIARVHEKESQARLFAGDVYYLTEKYENAATEFEASIWLKSDNYLVLEKLMICYATTGQDYKLDSLATITIEMYPFQPLAYYFRGISLYGKEKLAEARLDLETGLKYSFSNPQIQIQFNILLGDICGTLKDYDASDKYYEAVLRIDSNNTLALNNYSYSLAVRDQQLSRALRLSAKALETDSLNPAYLDTYGWILYRLNRYEEAEFFLRKAMNLAGNNDGTHLEHYGDVLDKLDRKDEATLYWRKALETGEHSEELKGKLDPHNKE